MYQPLIKFHPHPAIITQVLTIFVRKKVSVTRSLFFRYQIQVLPFTGKFRATSFSPKADIGHKRIKKGQTLTRYILMRVCPCKSGIILPRIV